MSAKFLWSGAAMVATLIALWHAGQAGWVRPLEVRSTTEGPGAATDLPGSVIAEGRLASYPGAEVVIATEIAGTIVRLPVGEKSTVHKGDLVAELDSSEPRAAREEAIARIDEAEAEIRFHGRELKRRRALAARHAASDVELETEQRDLEVARARRRAGVAAQRRCEALIAKTRITSPIDGVVIARFAHYGETVAAATRLVTIADLKRVRAEAEVDEVDIGGIAVGMEAIITAEGFPDRNWRGRVEEVPDIVVGRQLRPEDTARPVDTRILLVKIALLEPTPLKLGQRIEVEIVNPPHSDRNRRPGPGARVGKGLEALARHGGMR